MSDLIKSKDIVIVDSFEDVDPVRWENFVINHPGGNVFQLPQFYQVYKQSDLFDPVILIAKNEKEILGVLLAYVRKEFSSRLGDLTTRAIAIGGPLIKDNDGEVLKLILDRYNEIVGKKAIYSQLRNLFCFEKQKELFNNEGFIFDDHLDIHVDLTIPQEELWSKVNSKARNRYRCAAKKGTIFAIEDGEDALKECYNILKEVYARIKLPLPAFDYFLNLYKIFNSDKAKFIIFTAKYEGKIIGCLLALSFKDTIYGLYNGAHTEYYDKEPNSLLPWEIFLYGKSKGFKKFDWMGAGKPGIPYSVRDYKLKFGGELVNLGRFENVHDQFRYNIGKVGLKIYKGVKYS